MQTFVVIETIDIEVKSVEVFQSEESAREHFEACAKENDVSPEDSLDIEDEIAGTIGFAGDECYAVQLLEKTAAA